MSVITTEKELGEAIKRRDDQIVVEGNLVRKVLKIKSVGKLGWKIAIASLSTALAGLLMAPIVAPISGTLAAGAVSVLGLTVAKSALLIGIAGGSAATLNKLRNYVIVDKTINKLVLSKEKL